MANQDFVGCAPDQLSKLADRLKALSDPMASDTAVINAAVDRLREWSDPGPAFTSILTNNVGYLHDEAPKMRKHADLALEIQNKTIPTLFTSLESLPAVTGMAMGPQSPSTVADTVNVPWDITDQSYLNEAAADAGRLQDAINNTTVPGAKDTIADVGRILNDHADDPKYLDAFFAGSGTDSVLQTAHALHAIDGTTNDQHVLSAGSEQILSLYGKALSAATNLDVPSLDLNALGSPPNGDVWSESMLFKYGPTGDQWGSRALTIASGAMLDWRTKNAVRPDGDSGSSGGVGLKDPSNAWYARLGLSLDELTSDGNPDLNRLAARLSGIQDNDPSIVLMKSLSENPMAARDLFANGTGEADGAHFAHELVNNKWATPGENGNLDDSYWPGQVVAAATGDRITSPTIEGELAEAAADIFQATTDNYDNNGLQGNTAQLYASLPQNLVDSLAHAAVSYGPDLAAETDRSGAASDKFHTISNDRTDMTMVAVGANPMKSMLAALADNPDAAKIFNNGLTDQMAAVAANSSSNPDQAQVLMRQLGDLTGRFSVASELSGWKQAVAKDQAAQAANTNDTDTAMWINSVGGFFASVPLGWAEGKIGSKGGDLRRPGQGPDLGIASDRDLVRPVPEQ
jgi:hypothetical protein